MARSGSTTGRLTGVAYIMPDTSSTSRNAMKISFTIPVFAASRGPARAILPRPSSKPRYNTQRPRSSSAAIRASSAV
jgi:hypothetical protein